MGKIVSISKYWNDKTNRNASLESVGIDKYENMLDVQRGIIEELYLETESFIKEIGFPVDKFVLDEESAKDFMSSDIEEIFNGGEESLSLSYVAIINETVYRTLAEAEIGNDFVDIYVSMYKKEGKEWLIYSDDGIWEEGPGEDFF